MLLIRSLERLLALKFSRSWLGRPDKRAVLPRWDEREDSYFSSNFDNPHHVVRENGTYGGTGQGRWLRTDGFAVTLQAKLF
jgi:hypothetical protein